MKICTVQYNKQNGWSNKALPNWDSENTLILIFGAPEYYDTPEPIAFLAKIYPHSKIIGCSTSGEIYQNTIADASLSVAIVKFEKSTLKIASECLAESKNAFNLGERMGVNLFDPELTNVLILSDGLGINGSDLMKGLNNVLPDNVKISGGLAGDSDRFSRTWVIYNNKPTTHRVTAIGFCGKDLNFGYGTKGGWEMTGSEMIITKSTANVVFEINSQPALQVYKNLLGNNTRKLPASALYHPLAIRENSTSNKKLVRAILSIDEDEQSLTFAGDMPEGWTANMCQAQAENLIQGAWAAGSDAANSIINPDKDVFSIAISCVARRLVLGEQSKDEIKALLDALPDKTKQIGFYSYGEISPYGFDNCNLHNQTMTLTTLFES